MALCCYISAAGWSAAEGGASRAEYKVDGGEMLKAWAWWLRYSTGLGRELSLSPLLSRTGNRRAGRTSRESGWDAGERSHAGHPRRGSAAHVAAALYTEHTWLSAPVIFMLATDVLTCSAPAAVGGTLRSHWWGFGKFSSSSESS